MVAAIGVNGSAVFKCVDCGDSVCGLVSFSTGKSHRRAVVVTTHAGAYRRIADGCGTEESALGQALSVRSMCRMIEQCRRFPEGR